MATRIRNPEYYVAPQSAARMLRDMADDLDERDAEAWVSLKINTSFATKADVDKAWERKESGRTKQSQRGSEGR